MKKLPKNAEDLVHECGCCGMSMPKREYWKKLIDNDKAIKSVKQGLKDMFLDLIMFCHQNYLDENRY